MLQKETKDNSIVGLTLLLALVTTPMVTNIVVSDPILAKSSSDERSFALPQSVQSGTLVRIDGSSSMAAINQSLKQAFKKQFSGVKVEIAANGADAALKALRDGTIDLAAIGRELTPEEKAQGLEQILLRREKIAIVVGKDNPFQGSLTNQQFAQIFRGEITDWSQEVGGSPSKIRFIDRPKTSDTRLAFSTYPVFQEAEFATGSTATQLVQDSTPEVVKQLGKDGIGYAIANQVSKLQGVRILPISKTLPDDSKYPFSQPLVYVYKQNPSLGVISFLGFATASPGQQAQEEARTAEADAIASSVSGVPSTTTATVVATPTATKSDAPMKNASARSTSSLLNFGNKHLTLKELTPLLPWVLPLFALVGLLLLWLLVRRLSGNRRTESVLASNTNLPMPEVSTSTNEVNVPLPISKVNPSSNSVDNSTQTISPPDSHTTSPTSPQQTNLTNAESQSAAGTAQPLWLKFYHKKSDTIVTDETTPLSITNAQPEVTNSISSVEQTAVPHEQAFAQERFELDSPAAVVSNLYPKLPIRDETAFHVPSVTEAKASPELPNLRNTSNFASPVVIINSSPKQSDIPKVILTESEAALDQVADAAESTEEDFTKEVIEATSPEIQSHLKNKTAPLINVGTSVPNTMVESSIVLTPRTLKWAYAVWNVSPAQKKALLQQGGSQLTLRLYDVTNIDLSYQHPQLVQQYECEETIHNRFVAIPVSDRNYIAEIGYLSKDNRWLCAARSPIVRVFSRPEKDFYFVADAELIIHGAAEPGSTVSIGNYPIKTKADGTFHLRIPFTDSLIDYLMTATAADEEKTKTIRLQFYQDKPE